MNAWQKACRKRFVRHAFSCPVFESKKRGNIRMLAIFLAPVYILANVFTAYWLLRWMKEVHPLFRHPSVLGVILVLYAFFCTFPADELSDQKRSRSPDFKGHQQLLAWHVSVFSWLHRDSGAAALHFCAYGTDENLAVFSDGIESGRPWRDPFVTGMCIYGMVHAVHIYTTRYEVPSKRMHI